MSNTKRLSYRPRPFVGLLPPLVRPTVAILRKRIWRRTPLQYNEWRPPVWKLHSNSASSAIMVKQIHIYIHILSNDKIQWNRFIQWQKHAFGRQFTITFCLMMILIAAGHNNPAIVPIPFEMPISILAYLGAISKWFTLNPENSRDNDVTGSGVSDFYRKIGCVQITIIHSW